MGENQSKGSLVPSITVREVSYSMGRRHAAEHQLGKAVETFLKCAAVGHVGCQHELGLMMLGMDKADAAAVWWLRAAEQDHAEAMVSLGLLLSDRPETAVEGLRWIERARDHGSETAEALLRGDG